LGLAASVDVDVETGLAQLEHRFAIADGKGADEPAGNA
jgi:hypothetical protein